MIYHKSINLDGWQEATADVYNYVKKNTNYLNRHGFFWNTLSKVKHTPCYDALAPVFKSAGFDLIRISFLIINEPSVTIHADTNYPGQAPCAARINLPVLNCDDSETRFYSAIKWDPIVKKLGNGVTYEYHTPENCKLESVTTISGPTILRVNELHNVILHKPIYPRITLTCTLDPDPVYLLEEN
jgi:hypothetical protein